MTPKEKEAIDTIIKELTVRELFTFYWWLLFKQRRAGYVVGSVMNGMQPRFAMRYAKNVGITN